MTSATSLTGLVQKIVGAGFKPLHSVLGLVERGHHDDRHMRGARIGLQRRAHLKPRHVRHHHVEEHEVDALLVGDLERLAAAHRRAHVEIFGLQARLQEPHVGGDIIDDENARRHGENP